MLSALVFAARLYVAAHTQAVFVDQCSGHACAVVTIGGRLIIVKRVKGMREGQIVIMKGVQS